jgi:hypothetical protein
VGTYPQQGINAIPWIREHGLLRPGGDVSNCGPDGSYQKGRTDQEHLAAFTTWETEFWRKEQHVAIDILEDSTSTKGYILGRAYDPDNKNIDVIFLFGTRRGLLYNFRGNSSKWKQEELEVFLKGLFVRN